MRHGLADAEGVADREHDVADQKLVGISEIERREFLTAILDPQHREIRAAVLQHDLRLELALIGKRDLHLVRAFDDVVVGDDEAGGVDHDAGAERALHLFRLLAGHAEKAAEDGIVQQRVTILHGLGGINIDHGRLHALHDRGVGEPEFRGRGRHAPVLRQRGRGNRGGNECGGNKAVQHRQNLVNLASRYRCGVRGREAAVITPRGRAAVRWRNRARRTAARGGSRPRL